MPSKSSSNRLFHEKTSRIDFETLEILCKYLECDVSDLLEITD
ncbi:helix-turn-helix transcriptional regulator [uncultured Paraglaciecola sp.]